jgi:putative glutamate/gamma-aminobutyrate antiporter
MVSNRNLRVLSVFTLAMINVAAVLNLAQLSILAEYGLSAVFYVVTAALLFFIPVSLVSAELATGWPKTGGVYVWVKEAFGPSLGFLAIWLQWFENVVWYPTILSASSAYIAFAFNPSLASNPMYTLIMIFLITWVITLINFRGMKLSGQVSSYCTIAGTLFPAALVIVLGLLWVLGGGTSQTPLTLNSLVPEFNAANILFLVGIFLSFAGIEMSAVHAQEVKDPQKNYPKAILLSAFVILVVSVLGALAISVVVPKADIQLNAGVMEAFSKFFKLHNIPWIMPLIAILVAAGSVGAVSTWVVGPSKGLLVTARDGDLPLFFQKVNENGMPTNLLISQAVIITLLSLIFLFEPSVNSSYWLLTVLTSQLYLIMYILMFAAAIKLRYSRPMVKRPYKVPGGNVGMWVVAGVGIISSLVAILIGFIPPSQFGTTGSAALEFTGFLAVGIVIVCTVPFVIRHFRKPDWKRMSSIRD